MLECKKIYLLACYVFLFRQIISIYFESNLGYLAIVLVGKGRLSPICLLCLWAAQWDHFHSYQEIALKWKPIFILTQFGTPMHENVIMSSQLECFTCLPSVKYHPDDLSEGDSAEDQEEDKTKDIQH